MRSFDEARDESGAGRRSEIVAKGFVRLGDDAESDLRVKLLVVQGRLSLMSDSAEIGSWPLAETRIVRVDSDRFDITIDADTIGFFPDDSARFGSARFEKSKIVSGTSLRRRRSRDNSDRKSSPRATVLEAPSGWKRKAWRRARRWKKALSAPAPKSTRREPREAPVHRIRAEKIRVRRTAQPKASSVERRAPKRRSEMSRAHPVRDRLAGVSGDLKQAAARKAEARLVRARWRGRLAWYWVLDELRRTGIRPFNRLPRITDDMRREPGHEHSFEPHAARAGLIREVCSCGKTRLASRPIDPEGPRVRTGGPIEEAVE